MTDKKVPITTNIRKTFSLLLLIAAMTLCFIGCHNPWLEQFRNPTEPGNPIVLNPVTNTGVGASVAYADTIDLSNISGLFTIDANAGAPTYSIEGGTGIGGAINGTTLTFIWFGDFTIGLVTAATTDYAAGAKVTATLTVEAPLNLIPNSDLQWTNTATSVTITGYLGTATNVRIPAYILGIPVTVIGDNVFEDKQPTDQCYHT